MRRTATRASDREQVGLLATAAARSELALKVRTGSMRVAAQTWASPGPAPPGESWRRCGRASGCREVLEPMRMRMQIYAAQLGSPGSAAATAEAVLRQPPGRALGACAAIVWDGYDAYWSDAGGASLPSIGAASVRALLCTCVRGMPARTHLRSHPCERCARTARVLACWVPSATDRVARRGGRACRYGRRRCRRYCACGRQSSDAVRSG